MHYNSQTLTTTDDILNAFANFFSESYISDTDDLTLGPDSVINIFNIYIFEPLMRHRCCKLSRNSNLN